MQRIAAALALALAACSSGSPSSAPDRTVEVRMRDVRFDPSTLSVTRGETVRFRFTNDDAVPHDVFVGDAAAQAEHERLMRAGHEHGAGAVSVGPGGTGELTYTFDTTGPVEIGCHVEGHYPSGMRMTITVT